MSNSLLDRCQSAITQSGHCAAGLDTIRQTGTDSLFQQGLPTRKWETWKYTDIQQALADKHFTVNEPLQSLCVDPWRVAGSGEQLFVFVNGLFSQQLSNIQPDPSFRFHRLLDWLGGNNGQSSLFGSIRPLEKQPFAALNDAMFRDGMVIEIGEGQQVDQPLHVLFINADNQGGSMYPRLLIKAGRNSRAQVIEHYVSHDGANGFTNALTELQLESDCRLEHYRFNRESGDTVHAGGVHVRHDQNSELQAFSYCSGNKMTRNDLRINLAAPRAHCQINGVYLCSNKEHLDNHISIEHIAESCRSECLFKGSAGDHARAVFNGRIHIHPHAQYSDAVLYSKNLLLSPHAEIDTKPELEIYNDNVKAAHGATVSQIDDQQIHYLRSRGIGLDDARTLLNYAFVNDVVHRIDNAALRDSVNGWVLQYFNKASALRGILAQ